MPQSRKSFYIRRLSLLVLLINLFTAGVAYLVILNSYEKYVERARDTVENLALVMEENLAWLFRTIDLSLLVAVDEAKERLFLNYAQPSELEEYFKLLHSNLPEISSIRMVDAQGLVGPGAGVAQQSRTSVADRDYFQSLKANPKLGLIISEPMTGRISGKTVLNFARPITGCSGGFEGLVYASLSLEVIKSRLAGLKIGSQGIATLWDSKGQVVLRHSDLAPGQDSTGQTRASNTLRDFINSGQLSKTYFTVSKFDGIDRLLCARKVEQYPFVVNVGLSSQEYLAPWREELFHAGLMAALLFFLTLISAFQVYRALLRRDESMAEARLARDELESKVEERTAQLNFTVGELRLAKEQAESADRMKSEFLANISHELKTPLNPIVAFAEVSLNGELQPEQRENILEIKGAAQRLSTMIESLIELTGLETYTVKSEPFCPASLLESVVRVVQDRAREKGLALTWSLDQDVPFFVAGDQALIRLLLGKLMDNAIKFTEAGGVDLCVTREQDEYFQPRLCVCVSDSGPGIEAEKLPLVLGGLTQADAPLTKRYRGLGLGLAAVSRIVTLLRGKLSVESEPGQGSTFLVCIPYEDAQIS